MSANVNSCTFIGRVGKEPELRYTPSGAPVTTFSLAVTRFGKNDGGEEKTDWFTCVAWRQRAENLANLVSKGDLLYVRGSTQIREWTDQQNAKHTRVEVVLDDFQILQPKSSSARSGQPSGQPSGGQQQQPSGNKPQPRQQPQQQQPAPAAGDDYDPFAEE